MNSAIINDNNQIVFKSDCISVNAENEDISPPNSVEVVIEASHYIKAVKALKSIGLTGSEIALPCSADYFDADGNSDITVLATSHDTGEALKSVIICDTLKLTLFAKGVVSVTFESKFTEAMGSLEVNLKPIEIEDAESSKVQHINRNKKAVVDFVNAHLKLSDSGLFSLKDTPEGVKAWGDLDNNDIFFNFDGKILFGLGYSLEGLADNPRLIVNAQLMDTGEFFISIFTTDHNDLLEDENLIELFALDKSYICTE